MEKQEKRNTTPFSLTCILKSVGFGILVLFISVFICSVLINLEKISMRSQFIVCIFSVSAAFLSAAMLSAKGSRKNKMPCAFISCAVILLFLFAAGVAMNSGSFSPRLLAVYSVCAVCAAPIGSLLAVMFFKS